MNVNETPRMSNTTDGCFDAKVSASIGRPTCLFPTDHVFFTHDLALDLGVAPSRPLIGSQQTVNQSGADFLQSRVIIRAKA